MGDGFVDAIIKLAYLAAAILFILGLKGLTHPKTAVRGNLLGAGAMLLAVVATLCDRGIIICEGEKPFNLILQFTNISRKCCFF